MIKFALLCLITLAACMSSDKSKNETSQPDVTCYEDINIYSLEGVNPVKNSSSPCIEIKKTEERAVVTVHFEPNLSRDYIYTKKNGGWMSNYEDIGDTSKPYAYEFIQPDKVITFNYVKKGAFYLQDLTIIQESKQTIYFPEKGLEVQPEIGNVDLVISKAVNKFTTEISVANSVLTEKNVNVDKGGEIRYAYTNCYKSPDKSFYWWLTFKGIYSQKIECK